MDGDCTIVVSRVECCACVIWSPRKEERVMKSLVRALTVECTASRTSGAGGRFAVFFVPLVMFVKPVRSTDTLLLCHICCIMFRARVCKRSPYVPSAITLAWLIAFSLCYRGVRPTSNLSTPRR